MGVLCAGTPGDYWGRGLWAWHGGEWAWGTPEGAALALPQWVPPSAGPLESPSYAQIFQLYSHFLILSVSNFTLIVLLCLFWGWNLTFSLCNLVAWENPIDVVLIQV